MENPSGNYNDEAIRIKEKADDFAQKVITSALTAQEAQKLYHTIYIPSVSYGLASGCMTQSQAEQAQSKLTTAILTPLGYHRNTPREIVFAEHTIGGAGLRHLFAEQGTRQTRAILFHIRKQTSLGSVILIQLKWAQRISGFSRQILSSTDRALPHLQDEKWIHTLRKFLHLSELNILIPQITTIQPQRVHDQAIMDFVTSDLTFTSQDFLCNM